MLKAEVLAMDGEFIKAFLQGLWEFLAATEQLNCITVTELKSGIYKIIKDNAHNTWIGNAVTLSRGRSLPRDRCFSRERSGPPCNM